MEHKKLLNFIDSRIAIAILTSVAVFATGKIASKWLEDNYVFHGFKLVKRSK